MKEQEFLMTRFDLDKTPDLNRRQYFTFDELISLLKDYEKQLMLGGVVNCKHENYTPYYGREGELMEKRCDDCGKDID